MNRGLGALALGLGLLALAGCNSRFFQPDRAQYRIPAEHGLWREDVNFRSADGTELHGWFLPGRKPVLGTIVHFHDSGANLTAYLEAVGWLPPQGFSVFLFDYRGYGASQGQPERAGVIADGAAALAYVRTRPEVEPQRLIVYGQGFGAAYAIGALARGDTAGVKALVVEGGFASYRDLVRSILDRGVMTWAFQYPVAYLFFSDALRPLDDLPRIAGVPLLVVHGAFDQTVPPENGLQLYRAFPGRNKAYWPIPGADHQAIFDSDQSPWRTRLRDYFRDAVEPPQR
ncbi:MAG: alpha/beta hydrolase [Candidatus Lambdaproteobacteria bacterium]|nr:alpha/beta hydrolase [Candidatus Lambdaproteobacteria bacterium]